MEEELRRVQVGYLNESLFEARIQDLIGGATQSISGFPTVRTINAAARKAWPEWKTLGFSRLVSDDPTHEALRYWRDRRGVTSQAGLAVRTDLLNELIDSSSLDGDSFCVAFIPNSRG